MNGIYNLIKAFSTICHHTLQSKLGHSRPDNGLPDERKEWMIRLKFSGCDLLGGQLQVHYCRGLSWVLPSSITLSMSNQLGGDGRQNQQTEVINMFEGRAALQKGVHKQEES